MGIQDRDYVKEKHRRLGINGDDESSERWLKGLDEMPPPLLKQKRNPRRKLLWKRKPLRREQQSYTRAVGDEIYQTAPRRNRMPWWAKMLLAPFVAFGSLAGIGILVWSIGVVFRLTA